MMVYKRGEPIAAVQTLMSRNIPACIRLRKVAIALCGFCARVEATVVFTRVTGASSASRPYDDLVIIRGLALVIFDDRFAGERFFNRFDTRRIGRPLRQRLFRKQSRSGRAADWSPICSLCNLQRDRAAPY